MSTKPFRRVIWLVFDGLAHEEVKRCISEGNLPSLSRFASEGRLQAAKPSLPCCQTPPALLSLFCGVEPEKSGVWGYYQPDFTRDPTRSKSGFAVTRRESTSIWEELDARGVESVLINTAFRNDPAWTGRLSHVKLAFDSYRLWRPPYVIHLATGRGSIRFQGIEISTLSGRRGVTLLKGNRTIAVLSNGETKPVSFTSKTRADAQLLDPGILILQPETEAILRSSDAGLLQELRGDGFGRFADVSFFGTVRRENDRRGDGDEITLDREMSTAAGAFQRESRLIARSAESLPSGLLLAYFSLIDGFNHAYIDLLEEQWPTGRAASALRRCMALVDGLLGRLMSSADEDLLIVISSDHGAVPHRGTLHFNEVLADAGLVKRGPHGYLLRQSIIYYHPSDCGLLLSNAAVAAKRGLGRQELLAVVRRALQRAESLHGVRIAAVEGGPASPYLLFLYPLGDMYFTGQAPKRVGLVVNKRRKGGHHLSPLCPSPWIDAVVGLWSRRPGVRDLSGVPDENQGMKRFIMELLGAR